jgi:hypothetical protein
MTLEEVRPARHYGRLASMKMKALLGIVGYAEGSPIRAFINSVGSQSNEASL